MIAALGVLFFLEAGVQLIWGPDFKLLNSPVTGIINWGGISITEQRVLIIVASVVIMGALYWFLKRTTTGATIEAMAQNREGARLVGIPVSRVASLTFFISGALAAIAATLYAPTSLVSPSMGEVMNLKVSSQLSCWAAWAACRGPSWGHCCWRLPKRLAACSWAATSPTWWASPSS